MAIAFVQSTHAASTTNSSTTLTLTLPAATTAGNLLILTVAWPSGATLTLPGGFTQAVTNGHTTTQTAALAYAANCAGGQTSFTVTLSAAAAIAATLSEWSGCALSGVLDVTVSKVNNSTNVNVGPSAATANPNELVIGSLTYSGAVQTPSGLTSGYTLDQTADSTNGSGTKIHTAEVYQIVSVTGTESVAETLTTGVAWTALLATFQSPVETASGQAQGGSTASATGTFLATPVQVQSGATLAGTMTFRGSGTAQGGSTASDGGGGMSFIASGTAQGGSTLSGTMTFRGSGLAQGGSTASAPAIFAVTGSIAQGGSTLQLGKTYNGGTATPAEQVILQLVQNEAGPGFSPLANGDSLLPGMWINWGSITDPILANNNSASVATTTVTNQPIPSAGTYTVTPPDMSFIFAGQQYTVTDVGGGHQETITITSVSPDGQSFTAPFAKTHTAAGGYTIAQTYSGFYYSVTAGVATPIPGAPVGTYPAHDGGTDLRALQAFLRWKALYPSDTQFDARIQTLTAAVTTEMAGSTDPRGWPFFIHYELYQLLGRDARFAAICQSICATASKNFHAAIGGTTEGCIYYTDASRPNGHYVVPQVVQLACALITYAAAFPADANSATYSSQGYATLAYVWAHSLVSLTSSVNGTTYTLLCTQADNVVTPGTGLPNDNQVFDSNLADGYSGNNSVPGNNAEAVIGLLIAYQTTGDATLLAKAQQLLAWLDPNVNPFGLYDTTRGGYYQKIIYGGTGPHSPGTITLNTNTKEPGRQMQTVHAYGRARAILGGAFPYDAALEKLLAVYLDPTKAYDAVLHGYQYQVNADWTLKNPTHVVTSEAVGIGVNALLAAEYPASATILRGAPMVTSLALNSQPQVTTLALQAEPVATSVSVNVEPVATSVTVKTEPTATSVTTNAQPVAASVGNV